MTNTQEWLNGLADTIDSQNAKKFSEYITENGSFRFGNQPEVTGRKAIEDYVAAFFGMIKGSKHQTVNFWDTGDDIIWEAKVTYTRMDDKKVEVNFTNVFNMKGDLVDRYKIYIDNTPLFAE